MRNTSPRLVIVVVFILLIISSSSTQSSTSFQATTSTRRTNRRLQSWKKFSLYSSPQSNDDDGIGQQVAMCFDGKSGIIEQQQSTITTTTTTTKQCCPMLQIVPSVPVLGSFFPLLTGIPTPERKFPYKFNPAMNQRYGNFYRMKIPTFGTKDIEEDLYVLTDPNEMRKIVQSKPSPIITKETLNYSKEKNNQKYQYPVGFVEQQWGLYEYLQRQNTTASFIFTRGQDWWVSKTTITNIFIIG